MYDPKCYDLADEFLEKQDYIRESIRLADIKRLAQQIQDCIEDFIQHDKTKETPLE